MLLRELSLVWRGGATLPCSGFSSCGAQALGLWALVVVACGLSVCSSWAPEHRVVVAHGLSCSVTWDFPRPGIKLVSPTLADEFLSTVPPGKSEIPFFK